MSFGFVGNTLKVNLSTRSVSVENVDEDLFRTYLGGHSLATYYLLKHLQPGIDPLSEQNILVFATGVLNGAPIGGCGRTAIGAKSPLTGAIGLSSVGGFWGTDLKRAGYDAVIVEGKASQPVYLWINDGEVEIKDAGHLWGKQTAECARAIWEELGDNHIRVAQIGPAGESLVRYSNIMDGTHNAAGRTGMGAVMGSKNLKAIAVRGQKAIEMASPEDVKGLAKWLAENYEKTAGKLFHDLGTSFYWHPINAEGILPTRNYREGVFPEGKGKIDGRTYNQSIVTGRKSCWACPIQCKRVVQVDEKYMIDPVYGGPEYETLASFGSNCGINDLQAIVKGHQLCNAYGLDTISTGGTVAFAMECFEEGILDKGELGGIELTFGNAEAMLAMIEMIGKREGIGKLLGEGVVQAAKVLGKGAEQYAMHSKGQPIPGVLPSFKPAFGLGLAVSPLGANHNLALNDDLVMAPGPELEQLKELGVSGPLPLTDLGPAKVRMFAYKNYWQWVQNSLILCWFLPWSVSQTTEILRAVTGWNISSWELLKIGERCVNMTRVFNIREGFGRQDDSLPERFFNAVPMGILKGDCLSAEKLEQGKDIYYEMMGWDKVNGVPRSAKLQELGVEWVAEKLTK